MTLEEYNTRDAASFPQKRYQTADEYARSVVFICSPANSAISGQVICVDGAMTTAY
ncbi:MAG: SDR family oxidoreductase [Oscillospiraceae bacterium]